VIPDIIENKGGRIEPLVKVRCRKPVISCDHALNILQLPPHIRTVYRSTDATRTRLVAKRIDERSIELEVLEYLHTIQPQSSRIIPLIDIVHTNTGKWAILPEMRTIPDSLVTCCIDPQLCSKFAQLCCDLIEGLAYLHKYGVAHLDIKPWNLVCINDFRLQIIDFNSAVWVRTEDDIVEGDEYGTPGWMAPEMQRGSVFSPIRADRWSCSKVLLCFLETSGTEDRDLESFAKRLMDDNPLHQPSLAN
jgi:serine/threonine protein kinase